MVQGQEVVLLPNKTLGGTVLKQRYLVVEYTKSEAAQFGVTSKGTLHHHFPLHELMGVYHTVRIDDTHVFVIGNFSSQAERIIKEKFKDKVSILPHLASGKILSKAVNKGTHWQALQKHIALKKKISLTDTALSSTTMADLVDEAEDLFGPCFSPLS